MSIWVNIRNIKKAISVKKKLYALILLHSSRSWKKVFEKFSKQFIEDNFWSMEKKDYFCRSETHNKHIIDWFKEKM